MSSRTLKDNRGRFLNIEAHSRQLEVGEPDPTTTQVEATANLIDALLDYYKAAPISFWRTMERTGIILIGKGVPEPPDIGKLLCPNCGSGSEHDALCTQCQADRLATL